MSYSSWMVRPEALRTRDRGRSTEAAIDTVCKSDLASSSLAVVGLSESGSVRAMGSPTLGQAVIDELSRPLGTISDLAEPQRGVPTPSIATGGLGFVADLDTLRLVKHRQAGERHVFYVTFAAQQLGLGLVEMKYAYPVQWAVNVRPTRETRQRGRAGADIARIQLRFANGVTLSDDTDADVALFITESSVQLPATAVLLGAAGNEIRRETAFWWRRIRASRASLSNARRNWLSPGLI